MAALKEWWEVRHRGKCIRSVDPIIIGATPMPGGINTAYRFTSFEDAKKARAGVGSEDWRFARIVHVFPKGLRPSDARMLEVLRDASLLNDEIRATRTELCARETEDTTDAAKRVVAARNDYYDAHAMAKRELESARTERSRAYRWAAQLVLAIRGDGHLPELSEEVVNEAMAEARRHLSDLDAREVGRRVPTDVEVRATPEYRAMLANLTSVQERCTAQEQELRASRLVWCCPGKRSGEEHSIACQVCGPAA